MTPRIAVFDSLPMFRHGVAAVLGAAGFAVDLPADLEAWVRQSRGGLVLLTLETERDWHLLYRLTAATPILHVIALVTDDVVATCVDAIHAGARSVLGRGAAGEALRRTVEASASGQAVIPVDVLAALARPRPGPPPGCPPVEPARIAWLRDLAGGMTVARLAERAGYSERAMFRLLGALYKELGATSRTEALMVALDRGWLRPGGTEPSSSPRAGR